MNAVVEGRRASATTFTITADRRTTFCVVLLPQFINVLGACHSVECRAAESRGASKSEDKNAIYCIINAERIKIAFLKVSRGLYYKTFYGCNLPISVIS